MLIQDLLSFLEEHAPPMYQESYDNAGLITGQKSQQLKGVLTCLDATEAVIDEAIQKGCNLVVAHHPIVFKGLKRINGKNYVERVIIKAIQNDIAIYAIHTNLDNMYYNGVNTRIAEKLELQDTKILAPKKDVLKLFTFVPVSHSEEVRQALFEAGAGAVMPFQGLSYATVGVGTNAQGSSALVKLEVQFPSTLKGQILNALNQSHPEANASYDIIKTETTNPAIGSGMIGRLKEEMDAKEFLNYLKERMKVSCIRHTALLGHPIKSVAVCGGAGGFLLKPAIARKADIFITADYKYHEFFDADGKIVIADIGHFESEQFTIDLLFELISEKFSTFAVHCTTVNTNPVHYYF